MERLKLGGDEERGKFLADHTTGDARGEVMCLTTDGRKSEAKILQCLRERYAKEETPESLMAYLYSRQQQPLENLLNYSRALILIGHRITASCTTTTKREQYQQMLDQALCCQFGNGHRLPHLGHEIRKLCVEFRGKSFGELRSRLIDLFPDGGPSPGGDEDVSTVYRVQPPTPPIVNYTPAPIRPQSWQSTRNYNCYNCGDPSHLRRDCPQSRRRPNGPAPRSDRSTSSIEMRLDRLTDMFERFVASFPHAVQQPSNLHPDVTPFRPRQPPPQFQNHPQQPSSPDHFLGQRPPQQ
jgi:hypothetical protein